jgi:hypothetical protein
VGGGWGNNFLCRETQEGGVWQIALRALCVLEAVIRQGSSASCGEVAVHFQVCIHSSTISECLGLSLCLHFCFGALSRGGLLTVIKEQACVSYTSYTLYVGVRACYQNYVLCNMVLDRDITQLICLCIQWTALSVAPSCSFTRPGIRRSILIDCM